MRANGRYPPNTTIVPRILLALPLGLAVFALLLQFNSSHLAHESAAFGLFNENEFIKRSDRIPRLESQLRTSGKQKEAGPTRIPLPEGLGNESWQWPNHAPGGPKIAFISTTSESLDQIRVWMAYHRAMGVSIFYLFVEGQAASAQTVAALHKEPGVKQVIIRDQALIDQQAKSRIWNETWLGAFFNKPCNHELFVKQSLNMEMGVNFAIQDGVEWILHVDTDELMYPSGTRDYSLQQVLGSVPNDVDLLIFPNYESLPEAPDVQDAFTEVSLFKRNYAHVHSKMYYEAYSKISKGNPNYFITYGNGKSAARVIPGLRSNGAHRWHNYFKNPTEWSSEQAAILHYTYNKFSDLISRRDRCDCQPTKEDAERCFILPFDREAFLAASLKSDEELMAFFKQRLVWEDPKVVVELLTKGLFVRLYEPQLLIRGLREAMNLTLTKRDGTAGGGDGGDATATAIGIVGQDVNKINSMLDKKKGGEDEDGEQTTVRKQEKKMDTLQDNVAQEESIDQQLPPGMKVDETNKIGKDAAANSNDTDGQDENQDASWKR